jgi:hypothetical protein
VKGPEATGSLFAAGVLTPTPAILADHSQVHQCSWCGTLAAVPKAKSEVPKLGPCPACRCETWWEQRLPVGPFPGEGGRL